MKNRTSFYLLHEYFFRIFARKIKEELKYDTIVGNSG